MVTVISIQCRLSVDTLKCVVAQECQKRMKGSHGRLTTSETVEAMYKKYGIPRNLLFIDFK